MNRKSHKAPTRAFALALSFCFHTLLLWGAYYLPLKQWGAPSSEYSIAFYATSIHRESTSVDRKRQHWTDQQANVGEQTITKRIQAAKEQEKIPEEATHALQDTADKDTSMEQTEDRDQDNLQVSKAINQADESGTTIDERSLYKTHQNKQAGMLLELPGWIWDAVPQPQDDSDESGKIVFQITIDEFGEIIAVKTLEKTISPLVEAIYMAALTQLTFSKTDDTLDYAPTATGKVTFILQVK